MRPHVSDGLPNITVVSSVVSAEVDFQAVHVTPLSQEREMHILGVPAVESALASRRISIPRMVAPALTGKL
jgi:hypothetical protein